MNKSNNLRGKEKNCSENIVPARNSKLIHKEFETLRNNVNLSDT